MYTLVTDRKPTEQDRFLIEALEAIGRLKTSGIIIVTLSGDRDEPYTVSHCGTSPADMMAAAGYLQLEAVAALMSPDEEDL